MKPKWWYKFREMGKPKLYRNQILLLKPSNHTTKNTSHKLKADTTSTQNVIDPHQVSECIPPNKEQEKRIVNILRQIQVNEISSNIDLEDWKKKIKIWNERTRTSPSGVHLGHYKALHKPVMNSEDETMEINTVIQDMQTIIFETQLAIVNVAAKVRRPLNRWKNAVNIVTPKQKGTIDITKFRNIQIYECDLNAFLSIKWREALYQAEESKQLTSNQYGSQKSESSLDPVHIETLQLDLSRITRHAYGQINYDARACYDRILPNLASMASKAHNHPLSIVQLHFQLLTEMVYNIEMEGSTEIAQYSNQPHSPVFETGQGSRNSPTIWTYISNLLINSFENQAIGATYPCGYSEVITVKSSGYVDYVNTHQNDSKMASLDEAMMNDYSTWKGILHSSGGSLAQEQCNHYKITWNFKATGQPVLLDAKEGKIDNLVASIQIWSAQSVRL
jgi:hypothetical protein